MISEHLVLLSVLVRCTCDKYVWSPFSFVYNSGDFSPATMGMLRRSLHCVYVANSAFVNIQNVWRFLLNQPGGRNNGRRLRANQIVFFITLCT